MNNAPQQATSIELGEMTEQRDWASTQQGCDMSISRGTAVLEVYKTRQRSYRQFISKAFNSSSTYTQLLLFTHPSLLLFILPTSLPRCSSRHLLSCRLWLPARPKAHAIVQEQALSSSAIDLLQTIATSQHLHAVPGKYQQPMNKPWADAPTALMSTVILRLQRYAFCHIERIEKLLC